MLMVNIVALTRFTRLLLPGMLERNREGILNVRSIAGYQAGPHMSVYYATKAYVLSLTEGLREELKDTGLHVTLILRVMPDTPSNKTPAGQSGRG